VIEENCILRNFW